MPLSFPYAAIPALLLPWYEQNARQLPWRQDQQPYHVWLSEIMLQQTRVEAVRGYYLRFLAAVPDIPALAGLAEEQLLKLWEGLGYYSRARNLQKAARQLMAERQGQFPQDHAEILALPGIGPYTAGAIASICFDQPCPAVDGNVLRVRARLTAEPASTDLPETRHRISQALAEIYPTPPDYPAGSCGRFTQALMELGALVCTPKSPKCQLCPLGSLCLAREQGDAEAYPVRLPKREKRQEQRTVFLLDWEGLIALEQRQEPGLLAGLWQLPNLPGQLSPPQALAQAEQWGLQPLDLCRELHRNHIFTHIHWEMVCYHIRCGAGGSGLHWASPEELENTYALPTAFRIFLEEQPGRKKKRSKQ